MKTAKEKTEADDYMPGLKLRVKRDVYTHTTQTRVYDPPRKKNLPAVAPPTDSDGFGGSSGGSF